jgi:hypothetical protein
MDDPADVSSRNRTGWHLLDGCVSTRNRKVEGSNPSLGSKTAGQRADLASLAARRRQPVIPLGRTPRHGVNLKLNLRLRRPSHIGSWNSANNWFSHRRMTVLSESSQRAMSLIVAARASGFTTPPTIRSPYRRYLSR